MTETLTLIKQAQDLKLGDVAYCNYMVERVEGGLVAERILVGAWVVIVDDPAPASGETIRFRAQVCDTVGTDMVLTRMIELSNEAPIPVLIKANSDTLHMAPPELLASELMRVCSEFIRAQDRLRVLETAMEQVRSIVEDV